MKTTKNTSSLTNYTLVNDTIQLRLNFNTEIYIKDDVKLRLVKNIIERMNLSELKKVYSSFGRKPTVNPVTMLQIIIFCYSEGIFSSREIEKSCKYDLRIKYLGDLTYKEWYDKYIVEYNEKKEYENIVSILGYKVVENVEKYKDIKYNSSERYEQINREVNTIQMIYNHNSFSDKFKERVKEIYYEFRSYDYELNMHGAERFIKRLNKNEFTKDEILDVLNKDFNMRQISDERPIKFYNNIQAIYSNNGIEIHNAIRRKKSWDYRRKPKTYE